MEKFKFKNVENYRRTAMPIDKSCKKFIVAEKNVLGTRAEIWYHSLANLPTCFY